MSDSIQTSQHATAVTTPAKPKPQSRPKPRLLPPYAVILENDDDHSFGFVIETLQKVFGYGWFKSLRLTMQAHLRGQALVWSGSLEVAEFKRDRIRGMGPDVYARRPVAFGLSCRIEPLPG